jgi:flagellin-like protein
MLSSSMRDPVALDDEAVSPVIATVLLMAITVLLASAVYLMVSDAVGAPEKGRPYAKVSAQSLDNGFQVVRITDLSSELYTAQVSFSLQPAAGSNETPLNGNVNDAGVYGAIGGAVTFHDRDASYTVNRGDYFIINSTLAGSGSGDWSFEIRSTSSSSTILLASVPLPATE